MKIELSHMAISSHFLRFRDIGEHVMSPESPLNCEDILFSSSD